MWLLLGCVSWAYLLLLGYVAWAYLLLLGCVSWVYLLLNFIGYWVSCYWILPCTYSGLGCGNLDSGNLGHISIVHFFFFVIIMSGENSIIHLNGKNYASWEFQFRMFVKGKELWGHLDGSSSAPTDPKALSSWKVRMPKLLLGYSALLNLIWSTIFVGSL